MSRKILVFAHTGREDARDAARTVCRQLVEAGLIPVMEREDLAILQSGWDNCVPVEVVSETVALVDIELGIVLGGDGSILRAAEKIRHTDIPLVGVNLGHVGFLAEAEEYDLTETVENIVNEKYTVEERMAIDVHVWEGHRKILTDWALNEASVEKGNREKMLEVAIEVDRRPLSTFGCDGVVFATPTGSTAYAFSGGGPVVWPTVDAMLLVPLSAHALFARPLVTAPGSMMAVEILPHNRVGGVLWCDGRRTRDLKPGTRVEIVRSRKPVRLARMHPAPFSERLVRKFELPTTGWRGPSNASPSSTSIEEN
ncbi:NAD kinase [Rothia terrae]|uniref:NAD kinase n=1 Tax=Rothia terrae TaxID=396015 RepID=UPI0033D65B75